MQQIREHNPPAEEPELDLREIAQVLFQHRWLVVGVTVLVLAAGTIWTVRTPKIYQAATTLEYNPSPSKPLGQSVEDVADPIGNFWATREFFNTQNRVIESRDVSRRATLALGLHEDPTYISQSDDDAGAAPNLEATVQALRSRITVEPVEDTRLVRIHARDVKPERAQLIADAIADAYIDKTIEDRLGSTVRAIEWLRTQLDSLRTELDDAELALHNFKKDHNVLSVSMEDRQNLVASDIEALHTRLTEARTERIELTAQLERLRKALGDEPERIDPALISRHPVLGNLISELREKEELRDGLAVKYGAEHPSMKKLDEEIAAVTKQIEAEKKELLKSAERDLGQVKSIDEGLRVAAEQAHNAGLDLNLREIEYGRLSRERENKAKLYELVLQRLAETDLTRMLKTTHVRVLDRALLPKSPVSPNLARNMAAALLAGLLLGLGAAFLTSRLDRTVRSVESVEAMGITVLGVIPHLGPLAAPKKVNGAQGGSAAPDVPGADLIVHEQPLSAPAEAFRMIRTNLAFMSPEKPLRSLVVTSAVPREGKTTVAVNLATSLAKFGRSVLLVDTDLRRPRIHRVFDVKLELGVTSLIVAQATLEDSIVKTSIEGLHVLPAGPTPPNPSELLHSAAFGRLKDELINRYDWVVFDSPPMNAVTDAAILGPQVDGVLLVVRAGHTTRDSVVSARKQLGGVSARLIGSVLNDIDVRMKSYKYGQYTYRYQGAYDYTPLKEGADAA